MEETLSPESSILTRAARRHIPEDVILRSHRRESLKSYLYILVQENAENKPQIRFRCSQVI
jgi:hypothetical protein